MTQQEFVKKIDKPGVYIGAYADGLTKGLEIGKEFAEWATSSGYMKSHNGYGATLWIHVNSNSSVFTTNELLTIFLTEKYGQ